MKIIVKRLPKSTDKSFIDSCIFEYSKKGKQIKTDATYNEIILYYIEELN